MVDETRWMVGVLSKIDCLNAALQASYWRDWGETVADHISTEVDPLAAKLDSVAAGEAFLASTYRCFSVMQEGKLAGQVSRGDILRALSDHWGDMRP